MPHERTGRVAPAQYRDDVDLMQIAPNMNLALAPVPSLGPGSAGVWMYGSIGWQMLAESSLGSAPSCHPSMWTRLLPDEV